MNNNRDADHGQMGWSDTNIERKWSKWINEYYV